MNVATYYNVRTGISKRVSLVASEVINHAARAVRIGRRDSYTAASTYVWQ